MRHVKIEFLDHIFICPLCNVEIVYTTMQTVIVYSQRKCPSCQGELLIEQGLITAVRDKKQEAAGHEKSAGTEAI